MGPPNVLGLPKPASSISTSRTFGAPGGASGCPIRFQSGFDPSSVLLLTPWNGSLRIGRFVRSGSLIVCLPPVQRPLVPGSVRALSTGLPTSGTGHLFGNMGRHQDLPRERHDVAR